MSQSLDFAKMLPDWDGFPIQWLAKRWRTSAKHWLNLIDAGELKAVDLRTPGATRTMARVTRPSLLQLLDRRSDLAAVLAANPKPAYRRPSRRRKARR